MYTGGFVSNEEIKKLQKQLLNSSNRRWVVCPVCGHLFETFENSNHLCICCGYEGNCETVMQTL